MPESPGTTVADSTLNLLSANQLTEFNQEEEAARLESRFERTVNSN